MDFCSHVWFKFYLDFCFEFNLEIIFRVDWICPCYFDFMCKCCLKMIVIECLISGEKPYVCTVQGCGKRFTEYSSLYKHHVVHTHSKPYVCNHCGKNYRQTSTLAMHKRTAHGEETSQDEAALLLAPAQGRCWNSLWTLGKILLKNLEYICMNVPTPGKTVRIINIFSP